MNFDMLLFKLYRYATMEEVEREKIERLTVKAEGVGAIRYDKEKTQTQPALDRNEAATIALLEAKEKAAQRRRKRLKDREKASRIFWKHLSNHQAFIMELFYVHGMNQKQISDFTGLSSSWIYETKNEAEKKLKKMLAESKPACYGKVEE